MKVAFVCGFGDIAVSDGGGIGIVVSYLSRQMARYATTMVVMPGKKNHHSAAAPNLPLPAGRHGVEEAGISRLEVASLYQTGNYAPVLNPTNNRFLTKQLSQFAPDIVHLHDASPLTLFVTKWANKRNIPVVVTIHILPSRVFDFTLAEFFPAKFARPELSKLEIVRRLYRKFFADCDSIVALNEAARKDISVYTDAEKIVRIPNGVEKAALSKLRLSSLTKRPIRLTFVGHLCERKNQAYLIEVMQDLRPEFQLHLIGNELTQGYQKKLEKLAAQKAPGRVVFGKAVLHERIAEILAETHFFISASQHEIQSLVILEALASGTPVIALANETTTELVDSSVGKLLASETSAQTFAAEVVRLSALSDAEYGNLCQAARQRVEANSWENVAIQTYHLYQLLCQAPRIAHSQAHRGWGYLLLATLILTPLHFFWRYSKRSDASK